jgi:hypothetical protein
VGLVLLLGLAGVAFAVGGTVGLLLGDLVRRLGVLGLLTRAHKVAAAQPSDRTMLQGGDQVAGLLPASGRLGKPLLVLFALGGRKVELARLVAWAGIEQCGELVAAGAKVVLAHASWVDHLGDVGGKPLAAVPPCHGSQLVGLVLGAAVGGGHVQGVPLWIAADGGLGADDVVEGGPPDGAAAAHVQPLVVLGAGDAHQYVVAGDSLRLVPGGRVGQVHGAPGGVAAQPPAGPLVQVLPRQGHGAAVVFELERHRPPLAVDGDDLAAAGVGDPRPWRAFLPQTTWSPTAKLRSCTVNRSAPSWPWASRSCWQAVLSWSTSSRR